jgi:hypothetical protein
MGGVSSAAEAVRRFPGPPPEDPPTSPPRPQDGGLLGGARWVDRRMRCQLMEVGAASHRTCQPGWRGRCSVGDQIVTRSGASAAGVPPSAATGAVVEPLRALPASCLQTSAARQRAWRVSGVAIWLAGSKAQRPAGRSVRQAGLVHAQREGNQARGPRARDRAAVVIAAGNAGLIVFA